MYEQWDTSVRLVFLQTPFCVIRGKEKKLIPTPQTAWEGERVR